ncbi:xanthine dehydrogenase family protein molybdopterin-binding subunit [Actinoplanes sp. N902-109]|uniref:xanthine dehydrogenase family protein molybdopterin-binding subunit n=1 Tax=Actinoplanes sp. (strain N902-109) TaxID=649831 RepID=UPI0003294A75|nr:xanthine dehydrogenase family protein molybdopterin-binding subunit [Actinoplanes sp. N902-109]AGL16852.1 aldehyde oxidase and xanthine dehydrogenase molybdopterin-binding protein [Actinoplanes sp. N902-109]
MSTDSSAVALGPESWGPGAGPDPLTGRKRGLVGAQVSRVDGPLKVQGGARFAAEIPLAGMVHAALAFSTVARGRITALDTSAAQAAPGVVLVMTHENAPRLNPAPAFLAAELGAAGDDVPILQDDEIHWNGQPIAVVLAETREQADHAASLIEATYAAGPAVTSFAQAKAAGVQDGRFAGMPLAFRSGDAEAALAGAAYRVDVTYRTPRHNHNAIELHAATLAWDGDELIVHDATQAVKHTAWTLAQVFGIDPDRVHVTSPYVGGGFGGKGLWQHQILAAAAARVAGRPVRIMLSRAGVYRVVGGRAATEQRVAIGADADGTFRAMIHTGTTVKTRHNYLPEPFIFPTMCLYQAGSFDLGVQVVEMDMLANTFMRAPGESVGSFALESAIDELAERIGLDPVELRLRNEPAADPVSGQQFSSRHLVECYRTGAERFGWDRRDARPRSRREGEWLVGLGTATATYPYHRMPGGAARITLSRDGHARVEVAAHDMGMGTATAQAQITAERLGLPLDRVTVTYGDSSFPGLVLAGGSQQTASIGSAVIAAQRELVAELLKLAGDDSPLSGLDRDEVGAADGGLADLTDPAARESYTDLLDRAGRDEVSAEATAPPPVEAQNWSMHSYGALFCEVRVNAVTGEIRVPRFLGSFDCGRIINGKTAASQFRGGIIMGLGLALMEQTLFDERTGRIMNPSLSEYHVPVHLDVPAIEVMWTDIADPHAPMGARGIGEIGITGVGAAVANAVHNATGTRVRDLPITLDKVL